MTNMKDVLYIIIHGTWGATVYLTFSVLATVTWGGVSHSKLYKGIWSCRLQYAAY